ncbi:MAG: leucine-rich repeat domain-containing protein [Oscillospiraceae bacterium]|nr:leucine-rich repeat domain-containing protein [Oscillospiraceae bacterium]
MKKSIISILAVAAAVSISLSDFTGAGQINNSSQSAYTVSAASGERTSYDFVVTAKSFCNSSQKDFETSPVQDISDCRLYLKKLNSTQVSIVGSDLKCSSLTDHELVIPDTYNGYKVTEIGEKAFSNYYAHQNTGGYLRRVYLPDTIKKIGDYAFSHCHDLISINMPESLETIGDHAFDTCTSLNTIHFGNQLSVIGESAFSQCSMLETIILPQSVTEIKSEAFNACCSMKYFVCKNPDTKIIGDYTIGFNKNSRVSDFIIWGNGGNIQDYAQRSNITYKSFHDASDNILRRVYCTYPCEDDIKFTSTYQDCVWLYSNEKCNTQWCEVGNYFLPDNFSKYYAHENIYTALGFSSVSDYYRRMPCTTLSSGLAFLSAAFKNGDFDISDFSDGKYHSLNSACNCYNTSTAFRHLKVLVTSCWADSLYLNYISDLYNCPNSVYDYSYDGSDINDLKRLTEYAEMITYGADAAVLNLKSGTIGATDHSVTCFGLEYKADALDADESEYWNGYDARLIVYDNNNSGFRKCSCIYINLSTGNWQNFNSGNTAYSSSNGDSLTLSYNPDKTVVTKFVSGNTAGYNEYYDDMQFYFESMGMKIKKLL